MIDRTKPLTEQAPGDLRVLLNALHANRQEYDRANRIVEARSCELEIAEATRALAILNRRATEALDRQQGQVLEPGDLPDLHLDDLLSGYSGVAGTDAVPRLVAEIRRRRAEEGAARANLAAVGVTEDGPIDQLVCTLAGLYLEQKTQPALTADEVRRAVREAVREHFEHATAGDQCAPADAIADRVADKLVGRVVAGLADVVRRLHETSERAPDVRAVSMRLVQQGAFDALLTFAARPVTDPTQREADLREAFLAGVRYSEVDHDENPERAPWETIGPADAAAAEYARGKAGA